MTTHYQNVQADRLARTLWAQQVFAAEGFESTLARVRKDMDTLPGGFGTRSLVEACCDGHRFVAADRSHEAFRHALSIDANNAIFASALAFANQHIQGAN